LDALYQRWPKAADLVRERADTTYDFGLGQPNSLAQLHRRTDHAAGIRHSYDTLHPASGSP
jgi:hypothetical protein